MLAAAAVLVCACCLMLDHASYPAGEHARAALIADDRVDVAVGEGSIAFIPEEASRGFIFYPGGLVEHTAYAPLMRALAGEGWLCVLTEMPFDLAVLDMNAADGVISRYPQVTSWAIGGHSLGGAMAASYAAKHPEDFDTLVLLAAYSTADLTDTGLKVISLLGSEDQVLNREKYAQYRSNLPDSTVEAELMGGNHALFGDYGAQKGDGTALISPEEQLAWTVAMLCGEP